MTLAISTGMIFRILCTGLCFSTTFTNRSLDIIISLVLYDCVTEVLNSYLSTAVTVGVQ